MWKRLTDCRFQWCTATAQINTHGQSKKTCCFTRHHNIQTSANTTTSADPCQFYSSAVHGYCPPRWYWEWAVEISWTSHQMRQMFFLSWRFIKKRWVVTYWWTLKSVGYQMVSLFAVHPTSGWPVQYPKSTSFKTLNFRLTWKRKYRSPSEVNFAVFPVPAA